MQEQLVENLIKKALSNQSVEIKQTHISWLIIAEDFVYKIKKAVNFGFLDFSTLEKRREFCEQEIRLNSAMGADFYLDVVPISGDIENPILGDASAPIEYAVKMQKFDAAQEFSYLEKNDQLTPKHILQLVEKIVLWHEKAPVVEPASSLGTPKEIHKAVADNFELILDNEKDAKIVSDVKFIENWANNIHEKQKDFIAQRRQEGKVKSCHGDLHLANVVMYKGEAIPFDCIEFNLEFRYIDVINDLAFLLMDLDAKNQFGFSNLALNRYLELTGDYAALPLIKYYKSYRAMVRAKVNLLQFMQTQDDASKKSSYAEFVNYIELAKSYTEKKSPIVFITSGVTGSGKSTHALEVVEHLGALRLSSDIERKRMHGLKEKESSFSSIGKGIYRPEANKKTYKKLEELGSFCLKQGFSIILDATFLKVEHRAVFIDLAHQFGYRVILLGFVFDKATLKRRVEARLKLNESASEADTQVLENQLGVYEEFSGLEKNISLIFDEKTSFNIEQILNLINTTT